MRRKVVRLHADRAAGSRRYLALLVVILFPIFAEVREQGRQTACLSNLRQLGLATFRYA